MSPRLSPAEIVTVILMFLAPAPAQYQVRIMSRSRPQPIRGLHVLTNQTPDLIIQGESEGSTGQPGPLLEAVHGGGLGRRQRDAGVPGDDQGECYQDAERGKCPKKSFAYLYPDITSRTCLLVVAL